MKNILSVTAISLALSTSAYAGGLASDYLVYVPDTHTKPFTLESCQDRATRTFKQSPFSTITPGPTGVFATDTGVTAHILCIPQSQTVVFEVSLNGDDPGGELTGQIADTLMKVFKDLKK